MVYDRVDEDVGYIRIRIPTEKGVEAIVEFLEQLAREGLLEPAERTCDKCYQKAGVPTCPPYPFFIPKSLQPTLPNAEEQRELSQKRAKTLLDLIEKMRDKNGIN